MRPVLRPLSVALVLACSSFPPASAASYNTPEKAAALFATIDHLKSPGPYTAIMRELALRCTEGSAAIANAVAGVMQLHKKNTGRSIRAGTVLIDLLTATTGAKGPQSCIDRLISLGILYDHGADK